MEGDCPPGDRMVVLGSGAPGLPCDMDWMVGDKEDHLGWGGLGCGDWNRHRIEYEKTKCTILSL